MPTTPIVPTLGVDEHTIAAALGISVHTLRKDRRKARRIPFFKIGTTVRYNVDRVREALLQLEVGGNAPVRPRKRTGGAAGASS